MKINQNNLQKAVQQVTAEKVMFTTDEKTGAAWMKSIEKAEHNLKENHTIYFASGTLRFKSLDSKQTRIVTASGCVESFCDCKNGISYHKALHAILTRYNELEAEPLIEGEKHIYAVGGIETHYKVENGVKVKTVEKVASIRVWARGKSQPVTPPPIVAEVLQFTPRPVSSKSNQREVAA
jgi:hypothetical protein